MSARVEPSGSSASISPRSPAATSPASVLPSSTPHWSKASMPEDHALAREGLVLVEGEERAERAPVSRRSLSTMDVAGPVAGTDAVRHEALRPRSRGTPRAQHLVPRPRRRSCRASRPVIWAMQFATRSSCWLPQGVMADRAAADQKIDGD